MDGHAFVAVPPAGRPPSWWWGRPSGGAEATAPPHPGARHRPAALRAACSRRLPSSGPPWWGDRFGGQDHRQGDVPPLALSGRPTARTPGNLKPGPRSRSTCLRLEPPVERLVIEMAMTAPARSPTCRLHPSHLRGCCSTSARPTSAARLRGGDRPGEGGAARRAPSRRRRHPQCRRSRVVGVAAQSRGPRPLVRGGEPGGHLAVGRTSLPTACWAGRGRPRRSDGRAPIRLRVPGPSPPARRGRRGGRRLLLRVGIAEAAGRIGEFAPAEHAAGDGMASRRHHRRRQLYKQPRPRWRRLSRCSGPAEPPSRIAIIGGHAGVGATARSPPTARPGVAPPGRQPVLIAVGEQAEVGAAAAVAAGMPAAAVAQGPDADRAAELPVPLLAPAPWSWQGEPQDRTRPGRAAPAGMTQRHHRRRRLLRRGRRPLPGADHHPDPSIRAGQMRAGVQPLDPPGEGRDADHGCILSASSAWRVAGTDRTQAGFADRLRARRGRRWDFSTTSPTSGASARWACGSGQKLVLQIVVGVAVDRPPRPPARPLSPPPRPGWSSSGWAIVRSPPSPWWPPPMPSTSPTAWTAWPGAVSSFALSAPSSPPSGWGLGGRRAAAALLGTIAPSFL